MREPSPASEAHGASAAAARSSGHFPASRRDQAPPDLRLGAPEAPPPAPSARAYQCHSAPHAALSPVSEDPRSPPAAAAPVARQHGHHSYRPYGYSYYSRPSRAASPPPDPQPHSAGFTYAPPQQQQQQRHHYIYMQASYADAGPYGAGAHAHETHRPYGPPATPRSVCAPASMPHHIVRHQLKHLPTAGDAPVYAGRRLLTAEEKEMRRKISHSAIEKRRRERTNSVLRELQEIIPGLPRSGKIQKLEILEAATEYIRQLKHSGGNGGGNGGPRPAAHAYERPHSAEYGQRDGCPDSSDTQASRKLPTFAYTANVYSSRSGSEASDSSQDGSGEDTLTNPADMLDSSASPLPTPPDPPSMDVSFLLS